jgi:hypothetical protein
MGIRKIDKQVNYSHGPTQTKQQVDSCVVGTPLVHGRATSKHGLIRFNTAQTWGKPPPSPYSILCAWPHDQHPNVILSWDSQMGVSKFPKLGLLWLWRLITLCANIRLRWGLKQSCSPCRELSNGMWHVTCIQGNQGDSQLLVVKSQIDDLIPCLFFCHNLCLNRPNGSCEPILSI